MKRLVTGHLKEGEKGGRFAETLRVQSAGLEELSWLSTQLNRFCNSSQDVMEEPEEWGPEEWGTLVFLAGASQPLWKMHQRLSGSSRDGTDAQSRDRPPELGLDPELLLLLLGHLIIHTKELPAHNTGPESLEMWHLRKKKDTDFSTYRFFLPF